MQAELALGMRDRRTRATGSPAPFRESLRRAPRRASRWDPHNSASRPSDHGRRELATPSDLTAVLGDDLAIRADQPDRGDAPHAVLVR